MNEAAAALGVSRRALQELVKRHPRYYANGNRKLFEESDIVALRFAMRQAATEQRAKKDKPHSLRQLRLKFRNSPNATAETGSMWAEAQRQLGAIKKKPVR